VSFYGWHKVDLFMNAWRTAGFRPVGHLVFRKRYTSSARFLCYQHEMAYLLAKGDVSLPIMPIADVLDFPYTGNKLHPTQKPIFPLKQLIDAFCPPDGLVLDPFCGSGSTLIAAKRLGRRYVGIEIDEAHCATATHRLETEPCAKGEGIVLTSLKRDELACCPAWGAGQLRRVCMLPAWHPVMPSSGGIGRAFPPHVHPPEEGRGHAAAGVQRR
jgi:DNA modification methylase